jgi:hypothetical protein
MMSSAVENHETIGLPRLWRELFAFSAAWPRRL